MRNNQVPPSLYDKLQQGFTLIELMISLVLGLLISAAVIQVFITSQRVDRVQTAGSEIQDKAVFGLQSIEPQVRLANLGNNGVAINDITDKGGIVLTAGEDNAPNVNVAITGGGQAAPFLTRIGTLSNTGVPSDQLTIQYINTTGRDLFDCEGNRILQGAHVITRYFVADADAGGTGNNARKNLNLRCDAGRIVNNALVDFGTGNLGEVIIQDVDQFNIRLGVQKSLPAGGTTPYQYADMTVSDYIALTTDMALTDERPSITNIRIAILARSTANSPDASAEVFDIFGSNQTLKTQVGAPKHLRRVYESNILLRNARVMRIINSSSAP